MIRLDETAKNYYSKNFEIDILNLHLKKTEAEIDEVINAFVKSVEEENPKNLGPGDKEQLYAQLEEDRLVAQEGLQKSIRKDQKLQGWLETFIFDYSPQDKATENLATFRSIKEFFKKLDFIGNLIQDFKKSQAAKKGSAEPDKHMADIETAIKKCQEYFKKNSPSKTEMETYASQQIDEVIQKARKRGTKYTNQSNTIKDARQSLRAKIQEELGTQTDKNMPS